MLRRCLVASGLSPRRIVLVVILLRYIARGRGSTNRLLSPRRGWGRRLSSNSGGGRLSPGRHWDRIPSSWCRRPSGRRARFSPPSRRGRFPPSGCSRLSSCRRSRLPARRCRSRFRPLPLRLVILALQIRWRRRHIMKRWPSPHWRARFFVFLPRVGFGPRGSTRQLRNLAGLNLILVCQGLRGKYHRHGLPRGHNRLLRRSRTRSRRCRLHRPLRLW